MAARDSLDETLAAVWRIESPKIIARLSRLFGDIARAEDVAQDAFVAALAQWPNEGIPRNPGAWLMTAAKRRAIDLIRRETTFKRKAQLLHTDIEQNETDTMSDTNDGIDDDMLRLMFIAAHPVLSREARVTLMLRLLGGLTVPEIARAFLSSDTAISQRIVRAKRTLADAHIPFETPAPDERMQRMAPVLEAIYLIFNEGYSASSGPSVVRTELMEEALRLGRVLCGLAPDDAEAFGLTALMELQASRVGARVAPDGAHILLADQDRAKWNRLLIARGLRALSRAESLGGGNSPYTLQAAIAACHARAVTFDQTDWPQIAQLYRRLTTVLPTPVVALNAAIAVGMAEGAQAGLDIVDTLTGEPALREYHLLPSVRGDFLVKLGRTDEARAEFERAAELAKNERDREFLLARSRSMRKG